MSRIRLLNTYSTQNIGDGAIYSAYARVLNEFELVTDSANADLGPIPGIAQGLVTGQCDAYLSVGGDIFNNAREWLVTRRFLANIRVLRSNPPDRTFVFGQSIPKSCRGLAFRLLALAMRPLSSVYVRDAFSYHKLQRAGVAAQLGFDTAFALKAGEGAAHAARMLCEQAAFDPATSALISLRGFSGMYGYTSETLTGKLFRLATGLLRRGHQPVFVLQSRVDSGDDDLQIAQTLASRMPQARIVDLTLVSGRPAWEVAAALFAAARIVVAVRYHTSVLRMLSGRSAYNIHYSNKGADLVQRLGQPGTSLASFDPELAIPAIEQSAEREFDIAPVRARVRADLLDACCKAIGKPQPDFQQGLCHVQ